MVTGLNSGDRKCWINAWCRSMLISKDHSSKIDLKLPGEGHRIRHDHCSKVEEEMTEHVGQNE